jgi:hypothetical protein
MFGGRAIYGLLTFLVLPLLGYDRLPIWAPLAAAFTQSLPGVLLQIGAIPVAVALSHRHPHMVLTLRREVRTEDEEAAGPTEDTDALDGSETTEAGETPGSPDSRH